MTLSWEVVFFLYLMVARVIQPIFNKKLASDPYKSRNLAMQYILAATLAVGMAIFWGKLDVSQYFGVIVIIGIFNAFACYAYWQAIDISLSKTSLFTQGDDLITLGLGFLILGEAKFLNWGLGIGILICLGSAAFFTYHKRSLAKQDDGAKVVDKANIKNEEGLFLYIAIYSIIWGGAVFSMRYFALKGVTPLNYAAAWYFGAFLGAQIVYWISEFKRDKNIAIPKFNFSNLIAVGRTVLCIYTSNLLFNWVTNLAPISATQPIDQVAEMVFPTIIGLCVFKEIKHIDLLSGLAMAIGLFGGLLIAFSY